jgi:hypothetical protein
VGEGESWSLVWAPAWSEAALISVSNTASDKATAIREIIPTPRIPGTG